MDKRIAKTFESAEVGDYLWVFYPRVPVLENGNVVGYGAFELHQVRKLTKSKLTINSGSYDRRTGYRVGFGGHIAGEDQRYQQSWLSKNVNPLLREVGQQTDVKILRKIARLVGYEERV